MVWKNFQTLNFKLVSFWYIHILLISSVAIGRKINNILSVQGTLYLCQLILSSVNHCTGLKNGGSETETGPKIAEQISHGTRVEI